MPISDKILESLRRRPEQDSWRLVNAYQQLLDALFKLEQDEHDPDVLRDLASASIAVSEDLQAILGVLAEIIKE